MSKVKKYLDFLYQKRDDAKGEMAKNIGKDYDSKTVDEESQRDRENAIAASAKLTLANEALEEFIDYFIQ